MPTINYEHVDITTQCSMGREFQVFQQNHEPLKLCDRCDKPIRVRTLPAVSITDVKSANVREGSGKVSENPLLNAAFLYGPGGVVPPPGPLVHPTPQVNTPQSLPKGPAGPSNPGPLTG